MRLAAYAGTSAALAAAALVKAFSQRPNYYSATVYLAQSNACVLILTNLALVCTISLIYGFQRLLYGPLRPIETEQLSEKAWYAVLDTLLAMPSLRDDVGGWLLVIFVLLLAGKVWGWIAEGRVDVLEQQPPQNPRIFHLRLSASLLVSLAFSFLMFRYCTQSVLDNPRPGMMVIFTFEFAILAVFASFTFSRYLLVVWEILVVQQQTRQKLEERKSEIRQERLQALRDQGQDESALVEPTDEDVDENEVDVPGWEEKRRWLFGLELATDFIKIIIYTAFFTISLTFIGLPMHIMRDVYITIANFSKRVQDYSNYRRATQDMNTRYPDATAEELGQDNTCIVCREIMIPWDQGNQPLAEGQAGRRILNEGLRAKKLPCNHILHLRCLKAWLERQQACPTCRRPVITRDTPPTRDARGNLRPIRDILADARQRARNRQIPGGQPDRPNEPQAAGQPPQPRRNRMRWLRMGPVRVGFYNGPANDIQEAIQLRQEEALGSSDSSRAVDRGRQARRTAHLTNQDHFRLVEQRLTHQAHNLQLEQSQLAYVRMLETELSRLRSLYIDPSLGARTGLGTQPTNSEPPPAMVMPEAQAMLRYDIGSQATALRSGDVGLPPGLELPEGWSMVPLQQGDPVAGIQPIPPTLDRLYAQPSGQNAEPATTSQAEQVPNDAAQPTSTPVPPPSNLRGDATRHAQTPVAHAVQGDVATSSNTESAQVSNAASSAQRPTGDDAPSVDNATTRPGMVHSLSSSQPPSGSDTSATRLSGSDGDVDPRIEENGHDENDSNGSMAQPNTEGLGRGKSAQVEDVSDDGK